MNQERGSRQILQHVVPQKDGVLGRSDDTGSYCNLHGGDYSAAIIYTVENNETVT